MPQFRIIIPVFNPPPCLLDTLGALRRDGGNHVHTIVVDDGSTNGIAERIYQDFPEVVVIRGDGNLWWAGGMRVGMERALEEGAEVVVWLNHDCQPDAGTIHSLATEAVKPGIGAISAWCRTRGYEGFPVNPGFRSFKPIPLDELRRSAKVKVDGVNGNCVAINANAIRQIGLPETLMHPHYGDGPYTWRLHQAGLRNYVLTSCHASLSRELERCIDEGCHSMIWRASLSKKLSYYFLSPRSKFHWKHRFHDLRVFRGSFLGVIYYPLLQAKLIAAVTLGHLKGKAQGSSGLIDQIVSKYHAQLPPEGLRDALEKLSQRQA